MSTTPTDDMVVFAMPDGSLVSNDRRFDLPSAMEEYLASHPNKGDVGITEDEFKAQTQIEHEANINSAQPGVGPNATVDDPADLIPNTGTPAMRIQKDDLAEAKEAGADLTNTSVKDADPVDSNAAVKAVQEQAAAAQAAIAEARAKLGEEDEGDPDVPYSEWSAKQLKFELAKRNAGRDDESKISTEGISKKGQLAGALSADDEAHPAEPSA